MRWQHKSWYRWRRYFAWHPIVIGDEWVWLEYVERNQNLEMCDEDDAWWIYRNCVTTPQAQGVKEDDGESD